MISLKTFDRTPSLAELKVSYRRGRPRTDERGRMPFRVASPVSCEQYLRSLWDEDTIELREEFVLLCLNGAHEVLGWVRLHTGGFNHSPVDVRLVIGVALQTASSAVVVAHNHPSGGLNPSAEDVAVTRRIAEAAALMGIRLLDHLILTRDGCYSFADAGTL
jgi:DNA repair protein RadC